MHPGTEKHTKSKVGAAGTQRDLENKVLGFKHKPSLFLLCLLYEII